MLPCLASLEPGGCLGMLGRTRWSSGGECQGRAQLLCKVWTQHEWPHSRSQPSSATSASPRGRYKQLWGGGGGSLLVCVSPW